MDNIEIMAENAITLAMDEVLGRQKISEMFKETLVFEATEFGDIFVEGEDGKFEVIEENLQKFTSKLGGLAGKTAGALGAASLVLYALGAAGASVAAGLSMVGLAAAAIIIRRMPINVAKRVDAKLIKNVAMRDKKLGELEKLMETDRIDAASKIQNELKRLTMEQKKIGEEYMKVLSENRGEMTQHISDREFEELQNIAISAQGGAVTNLRSLIGKSLAIR